MIEDEFVFTTLIIHVEHLFDCIKLGNLFICMHGLMGGNLNTVSLLIWSSEEEDNE